MGYELRIQRPDEEIPLEAWLAAVESTPGVAQRREDLTAKNPLTGELIVLPWSEGDASVEVNGKLLPVHRWFKGGSRSRPASVSKIRLTPCGWQPKPWLNALARKSSVTRVRATEPRGRP